MNTGRLNPHPDWTRFLHSITYTGWRSNWIEPTGNVDEVWLRSLFPVPQPPVVTQPPNGPGPGMEYGHGQPSPLLSSLMLSAGLVVYNDLVVVIGTV